MDVPLELGGTIAIAAVLFWGLAAVAGLLMRAFEAVPGFNRLVRFFAPDSTRTQQREFAIVLGSHLQLFCWCGSIAVLWVPSFYVAYQETQWVLIIGSMFVFSVAMAIIMCAAFAIYERIWIGRILTDECHRSMSTRPLLRSRISRAAQTPRLLVHRILAW